MDIREHWIRSWDRKLRSMEYLDRLAALEPADKHDNEEDQ